MKVIDRTALILDIFALHARTREGKVQVELAQLNYLLPRLRGWGEAMSPARGRHRHPRSAARPRWRSTASTSAGGSRSSGATSEDLAETRDVKRARRQDNRVPQVAIAGYTNAGKSTLLNQLTGARRGGRRPAVRDARPDDAAARAAGWPPGDDLSDTVGFVEQAARTTSSRRSVRRWKR